MSGGLSAAAWSAIPFIDGLLCDGCGLPFEYDRFNSSLADVYGFTTWWEADRVFDRVARKIAEGDL